MSQDGSIAAAFVLAAALGNNVRQEEAPAVWHEDVQPDPITSASYLHGDDPVGATEGMGHDTGDEGSTNAWSFPAFNPRVVQDAHLHATAP